MFITGKYRIAIPLVLSLAACGSGSDDTANEQEREPEPGTSVMKQSEAGKISTPSAEAGRGRDTRSDLNPFVEALADAGVPGPCGSCVRSECFDSMSDCANDSKCVQGFVCTMMQCMATAGYAESTNTAAGLSCTLGCFQNDMSAALLAGSSANCIARTCQDACSTLLQTDAGGSVDAFSPDRFVPSQDANPSGGHIDASVRDASEESELDAAEVAPRDSASEGAAHTSRKDAGTGGSRRHGLRP